MRVVTVGVRPKRKDAVEVIPWSALHGPAPQPKRQGKPSRPTRQPRAVAASKVGKSVMDRLQKTLGPAQASNLPAIRDETGQVSMPAQVFTPSDYIHLRLIPDISTENSRIDSLVRALWWWRPPLARWNGRGFSPQERAVWEIVLDPSDTMFTLTIPESWRSVTNKQITTAWPRVAVRTIDDPLEALSPTACGTLSLRNHFFLSLRVDRRSTAPVGSLLESLSLLEDGERAVVQVVLDPAGPDWWNGAADAYESFRAGNVPKRHDLSIKGMTHTGIRTMASTVLESISVVQMVLGDVGSENEFEKMDLDEGSRAQINRDGPLSAATHAKMRGEAFDTTIRIAVQAKNAAKAEGVLRAIAYAFRDLDGDNALIFKPAKPESLWPTMRERKSPKIRLNHDYLGVFETGRLLQLPTRPLQEQYGLVSVSYRETDLPGALTGDGMFMGVHTWHGQPFPVYLPIGNLDELCLPHVVIGGMGTGKTRGFGANMAVEAVLNGFTSVVLDPARGEIGDEIQSVLPPEQIIRIRFGEVPLALDWREAFHSPKGRNRFANELISFFEASGEEAGPQTARYLRSAAKVVPSGQLSEIIRLFTEDDYLDQLIDSMPEKERVTWEAFRNLTDARKAQVASPVLNRLDLVLGDDYLSECMETTDGLDFVKLIDAGGPKAIILDLPKNDLGTEVVDILGSLLVAKLNLAMVLRSSEKPVIVVQDEPHQYLRSARIWRSAVVESRKWRFGYTWLFHSWEQLPRDLAEILKSAGPHYHLYTSSKATYKALAEEMAPFTVEEALQQVRTHWAINIVRAENTTVPPFLALMAPPPSLREKIDIAKTLKESLRSMPRQSTDGGVFKISGRGRRRAVRR